MERAIAGEDAHLKEQIIGVEVFDRKPDYDPRIDPIVRVEARRLRAKLKAYYAASGRNDEMIVTLPKGGYVPVVAMRSANSTLPAAAKRNKQQSVAVLPFQNLGADDLYFSDGLTEELIHRLTRVAGLRVVAWSSTSLVRGSENDLARIRTLLRVRTIVRGSVRRAADQVRVTAQLIDCESGTYLWSETFERKAESVFEIQDDLARSIVQALELKLAAGAGKQQHKPLAVDYYNLCLQGRFLANKRTKESLEKSAERFEEAIRVDDSSPQAFAGLADAISVLGHFGFLPPSEALPKARAAAERALELDPESVEANISLAFIRTLFEWKWREGEHLYRTAIRLNPGNSHARHWYGLDHLALSGRFDEAIAEMRVALDLDPLTPLIHEGWGYVHLLKRDYDGALAIYRQLTDMDPQFFKAYNSMGRLLSLRGEYQEAIAIFERSRQFTSAAPSLVAALGQTYALAGKKKQALAMLEELRALAKVRWVPESCFAILELGLGDHAKALRHLETAADRSEMQVSALKVHPLYDPLRGDPRFERLLARVGFLP
jgi:serine/threonine-protein kinase